MSSKIDLPLNELVRSGRSRGGRGRGKGANKRGGGTQGQGKFKKDFGATRGRGGKFRGQGKGIGRGSVKSRLTTEKPKAFQNGGVNDEQISKVSDLRDLLASKNKSTVMDLRAKLPPKPESSQTEKPNTRNNPGLKTKNKPLYISSTTFSRSASTTRSRPQASSSGTSSRSKEPFSSRNFREAERRPQSSSRLPTTAEAKKITVTVQGLSKTTSQVRRLTNDDSPGMISCLSIIVTFSYRFLHTFINIMLKIFDT